MLCEQCKHKESCEDFKWAKQLDKNIEVCGDCVEIVACQSFINKDE